MTICQALAETGGLSCLKLGPPPQKKERERTQRLSCLFSLTIQERAPQTSQNKKHTHTHMHTSKPAHRVAHPGSGGLEPIWIEGSGEKRLSTVGAWNLPMRPPTLSSPGKDLWVAKKNGVWFWFNIPSFQESCVWTIGLPQRKVVFQNLFSQLL